MLLFSSIHLTTSNHEETHSVVFHVYLNSHLSSKNKLNFVKKFYGSVKFTYQVECSESPCKCELRGSYIFIFPYSILFVKHISDSTSFFMSISAYFNSIFKSFLTLGPFGAYIFGRKKVQLFYSLTLKNSIWGNILL